jgi:hypothetical protein
MSLVAPEWGAGRTLALKSWSASAFNPCISASNLRFQRHSTPTHTHMHACMNVCICVCIYVYIYVFRNMCVCVCVCVCVYIYIYIYSYRCTDITHTHAQAEQRWDTHLQSPLVACRKFLELGIELLRLFLLFQRRVTTLLHSPLLVYAAWSYQCMRPWATSVWGLKLLVHATVRHWCMWP